MALALALATIGGWIGLALVALVWRHLRSQPVWEPWEVLCGVRAVAVEQLADSLTLRLSMADAGHEWAQAAHVAGNTQARQALCRASVATTRVLARQLDGELVEYEQHARVLQAAADVAPLNVSELRTNALHMLARVEGMLRNCVGRLTRLRVRLWVLRLGLIALVRRLDRAASDGDTRLLHVLPAIHADLAELSRATTSVYGALLVSLQASRERVSLAVDRRRH